MVSDKDAGLGKKPRSCQDPKTAGVPPLWARPWAGVKVRMAALCPYSWAAVGKLLKLPVLLFPAKQGLEKPCPWVVGDEGRYQEGHRQPGLQ